jgi:16S rRNA (guanine966-N2)-methyltransferase
MLQPWIKGSRVLDLFAGSGAVGLELISRGATGSHFVDNSAEAIKCLKVNMAGLAARAKHESIELKPFALSTSTVELALTKFLDHSFDLIWADPPYDIVPQFLEHTAPQWTRLLADGGVLTLECADKDQTILEGMTDSMKLTKVKQRAYGVSLITIWQK